MIHHLSIAARDPQRAADALAEMMGGRRSSFRRTPAAFSRCSSTITARGSRSIRPAPCSSRAARSAAALPRPARRRLPRDPFRAQRQDRRRQGQGDRRTRRLAMLRLQPRPVPRHRGVDRERVDGRNPAAGIRRRICRLHQPGKGADLDGQRPRAERQAARLASNCSARVSRALSRTRDEVRLGGVGPLPEVWNLM